MGDHMTIERQLDNKEKRVIGNVAKEAAERAVEDKGNTPEEKSLSGAAKQGLKHVIEKGFDSLRADQQREVLRNLQPYFPDQIAAPDKIAKD